MKLIETTEELSDFCLYASKFDFVTIDTEFLREKTYYSKLCLVQIAVDSNDPCSAVIIDALSPNLDLEPLNKLLINSNIIKVFHAARQDLEIFYNLTNLLPTPIFDTQVAAMVCGFGEQVGYDSLLKILRVHLLINLRDSLIGAAGLFCSNSWIMRSGTLLIFAKFIYI